MIKKGILLIGHGSTLPYNQDLVEKTAAMIAKTYPAYIVKSGFMNINKPSIPESLDHFRNETIEALVILPLFLAKGVHTEIDIPAELALSQGVKKGKFIANGREIPMVYADPIGIDPLLADLMVKNASKALALI